MCERLDAMSLTQLVDGPPTTDFVGSRGGIVKEECVLIGMIDAPADRRQYLSDLGINLTYAGYDPESQLWERCLMSEGVADLLEDLHAEGDFPYHFEVAPSRGELLWLQAQAQGAAVRPELPLHDYLLPACAEDLATLAGAGQRSENQEREDG